MKKLLIPSAGFFLVGVFFLYLALSTYYDAIVTYPQEIERLSSNHTRADFSYCLICLDTLERQRNAEPAAKSIAVIAAPFLAIGAVLLIMNWKQEYLHSRGYF
jgi:hypothetical protein